MLHRGGTCVTRWTHAGSRASQVASKHPSQFSYCAFLRNFRGVLSIHVFEAAQSLSMLRRWSRSAPRDLCGSDSTESSAISITAFPPLLYAACPPALVTQQFTDANRCIRGHAKGPECGIHIWNTVEASSIPLHAAAIASGSQTSLGSDPSAKCGSCARPRCSPARRSSSGWRFKARAKARCAGTNEVCNRRGLSSVQEFLTHPVECSKVYSSEEKLQKPIKTLKAMVATHDYAKHRTTLAPWGRYSPRAS